MPNLEDFAEWRTPLSDAQIDEIQAWIDEDWEAADIDREIVTVIQQLILTIKHARNHAR